MCDVKCPEEYKDVLYGEGDAKMHYDDLVTLHNKVHWGEYELRKDYV